MPRRSVIIRISELARPSSSLWTVDFVFKLRRPPGQAAFCRFEVKVNHE